ncbi:phosphatase PAP2 family protein [Aridibaculum aurantiacum]|uniref:phosphatase PAP2 family protein n=1 Tax=Aridibaculum aurantiacum TaxID=2810307 RepID=UPI001A968EA7|nr:phosphatase PAP2 family protein [Aridibaculum aurantiacum]
MNLTRIQNEKLKKLPLRFLLLLVMFLMALFGFGFIIHEVLWEQEYVLDKQVATYVSVHLVNDNTTAWMTRISFLASRDFLFPAYVVLTAVYLFYVKNKILAAGIALVGLTGYLINLILKSLFRRERPADQLTDFLENFSFPSGHSMSAFIFYGLLIYLLWQTHWKLSIKAIVSVLLSVVALLIGFSRIYLQVHYTTDVLGGFCVGLAWLLLAVWLLERQEKRRHKRRL